MKKKLIAILLTTTLVAGVGFTAYNIEKSNRNKESVNNEISNNNDEDKPLEVAEGNESQIDETANKEENIDSNGNIIENNIQDVEKAISEEESQVVKSVTNNTKEESVKKEPVVERPEIVPPTVNTPGVSTNSEKFMSQVEQLIYQKVNAERAGAGVSGLAYNSTMEKYARIKSADMAERGYFEHEDPDGNLITVKMKNDGVSYKSWGENIAYIGGMTDASALANQFMINWMNSPGHRANILSGDFTSIGVGVYKIGNTVYASQEFHR